MTWTPPAWATRLRSWLYSTKPGRVFRHFSRRGGTLLAAGMAYKGLFAIFAAVWVAFASLGLWLSDRADLSVALIDLINRSVPNLIGPEGVVNPQSLPQPGTLGLTGAIALVGLLWTVTGWLHFTRIAVRSTFGLPRLDTNIALLRLRDLALGLAFGLVFVISAIISVISTAALGVVFDLLGLSGDSTLVTMSVRVTGLVLTLAIDTFTLAGIFRVLSEIYIPWRRLIAGSFLGALVLGGLKTLAPLIFGGNVSNPLLSSFIVFIALLLWFNLTSMVILLAASWIAVGMEESDISPRKLTPEQLAAEMDAKEAEARRVVAEAEIRHLESQYEEARGLRRRWLGIRLGRSKSQTSL